MELHDFKEISLENGAHIQPYEDTENPLEQISQSVAIATMSLQLYRQAILLGLGQPSDAKDELYNIVHPGASELLIS